MKNEFGSKSKYNMEEASALMSLFKYFLPLLNSSIETDTTLLAIITPYAAQVRVLKEMFEEILTN